MNLNDVLIGNAGFFGDRTAVIFRDRMLSYRSLLMKARKCASAMSRAGVKTGDTVCIACRNSAEYIELLFACSYLGATPALINWRIAPVSVLDMVRQAKAKLLFVSDTEQIITDYFRSSPAAEGIRVIVTPEATVARSEYSDFLETGTEDIEPAKVSPEAPGLILYTSGTTGRSKGVVLSNRAIITQVFNTCICGRWKHDEVFMCVSPICHSISLSVMAVFCMGGTLVLCPVDYLKDCDMLFRIIEGYGVTRTALVPTVIERIVSYAEEHGIKDESLRTIGYGASPMNEQLIERCHGVFSCGFHQGYGMTEAYGTVTALLPEDHDKPQLLRSVGRPMMGCSVRICDDAGNKLGAGETGEIQIRSDSLMSGYLGMPELTAEVIKDGWYHTGDIGYLNEEGYLFLTDRKKDMIITGGENVFPAEIERCIMELYRDVSAVSVAGIKDRTWGEIIVAAVVRKNGSEITEKDITSWCGARLANFKKPKKVMFVDALPLTDTGKVSRVKVRELFRE